MTLGKLFLGSGQESLADRLANRDNHFNFVRLLLASMVMIDHAGLVVSGMAGSEPFRPFGVSLGYMAVDGFFILSGLLIANFPDLSWPRLLLFSTILTLPAAWVSWTFIEKTALRYKKGFRANGKTKSVAY